jgi:hypothetical protein
VGECLFITLILTPPTHTHPHPHPPPSTPINTHPSFLFGGFLISQVYFAS